MTNEQAKEILEKEKAYMLGHGGDRQAEALEMAIKALEQQPCEDYCVSRQAVIDYIQNSIADLEYKSENAEVINDIKNLPPVTPTHGMCKDCKNGFQTSFCGSSVYGCEKHKGVYQYDFYCKDFEKRG